MTGSPKWSSFIPAVSSAWLPFPRSVAGPHSRSWKEPSGSLGLKGVVIRSQASGLSLDAKEFYPFYEKVCALDIPIFVHPSGVPDGFDILNAPYDLHRQIGRELDLIVATTRLILSGVLEDFPDLKLVISHKGGGIAALRERILYRFAEPGAPGTRMRRSFDEYLSKLYFNLAGHWGGMQSVACALTTISPSRLVFATDYPQNFFQRSHGDQDLHREHQEPEHPRTRQATHPRRECERAARGWRDEFLELRAVRRAIAPQGRTAAAERLLP